MTEHRILPEVDIEKIIHDPSVHEAQVHFDAAEFALHDAEYKGISEEAIRDAEAKVALASLERAAATLEAAGLNDASSRLQALTDKLAPFFEQLDRETEPTGDPTTDRANLIEAQTKLLELGQNPSSLGLDVDTIQACTDYSGDCTQAMVDSLSQSTNLKVTNLRDATESCASAQTHLEEVLQDPSSAPETKVEAQQAVEQAEASVDQAVEDVGVNLEAKGLKKEVVKALLKTLKFAAGIGTIFLFLWLVSKSVSGCYEYVGTDRKILSCPNTKNKGFCNCGDRQKFNPSTQVKHDELCVGNDMYPFCCSSGETRFCTEEDKVVGVAGTIYYTWVDTTPLSLLGQVAQDAVDFTDAIADIIKQAGSVLSSILKYGLIIIVVIILIWLISLAIKLVRRNK